VNECPQLHIFKTSKNSAPLSVRRLFVAFDCCHHQILLFDDGFAISSLKFIFFKLIKYFINFIFNYFFIFILNFNIYGILLFIYYYLLIF
jgi:hypothetical protein